MARGFATAFHRQMVVGFAGDVPPVDPMAAGTTWQMGLARADRPASPAKTFQAYYSTNAAITITAQLWIHGEGADWIIAGAPLAAIAGLRGFECPGKLDDALIHLQVTPTAPLGAGETIDLYLEETDEVADLAAGLRFIP